MVIRTYECLDCNLQWEVTCNSDDGDPDCPECSKVLEWRPGMFSIPSAASKAVAITQDIIENDYGLTNFKDNLREGDVAAITPSPSRELEQVQQQWLDTARTIQNSVDREAALKNTATFFNSPGHAAPTGLIQQALSDAKNQKGQGVDAMAALHKMGKAGQLPVGVNPIARAKMS